MSKKKKKKDWRGSIVLAISILIGGFGGFYGAKTGFFDDMTGLNLIVFLASLVLWFFLGIVIHELGHLICGKMSGYRFGFFKLGSLSWFREDGTIKFKRSKNFAPGQCLMIPPDDEADFRFLWYNLGGGVFNLLTGLALWLLWFLLSDDHILKHIATAGIVINVLFGVTNLIPIRSQGNDGANIVGALKSTDGKRAFYLTLYINGQLMLGKRFSEIDEERIRHYGKMDPTNHLVGNLLMYEMEYLLETDLPEEALMIATQIDTAKFPAIHAQLFKLYQLLIYTAFLPDFDKARAIYKDKDLQAFLKLKLPSITVILVAYEFFVNNDRAKAEKLLVQAKKDIANLPNKGERLGLIDYLAEIEAAMQETQGHNMINN